MSYWPPQLEAIGLPLPAHLLSVIGGRIWVVTTPTPAAPNRLTDANIECQLVHNCGIFGLRIVRHLRRHNGTATTHGFGIQFRIFLAGTGLDERANQAT